MVEVYIGKICFEHDGMDYEAEIDVECTYDTDWGADADGNRGVPRLFLDEISVESIENMETGNNDLTPELEDAIWDYVSDNLDEVVSGMK